MNKFKPSDLIKLDLDQCGMEIALYPTSLLDWEEMVRLDHVKFKTCIGEVIILQDHYCIVWWPQLNGYNIFIHNYLKPANAHV